MIPIYTRILESLNSFVRSEKKMKESVSKIKRKWKREKNKEIVRTHRQRKINPMRHRLQDQRLPLLGCLKINDPTLRDILTSLCHVEQTHPESHTYVIDTNRKERERERTTKNWSDYIQKKKPKKKRKKNSTIIALHRNHIRYWSSKIGFNILY